MRRTITAAALAVLTLVLLAPGSPAHATTPAAAASPSLVVDTPHPPQDLQPITLTGSGLTPGETLYFMECEGHSDLCTIASGASGRVDPSGRLTLTATARRYLPDYMDIQPRLDCAFTDCGLAFVRQGDYTDGYQVVVETFERFEPTVPSSPSVTVEAPMPLPAVVSTRLLGHGFAPGSSVLASRCFVMTPDEYGSVDEGCDAQQSAVADADGNVEVPIELRRVGAGLRAGVDCADTTQSCSVRLDGPAYGSVARASLVFDPSSFPPPPPKITVSPVPVTHVTATVTVTGHGFRPDHDVYVTGPGAWTTVHADASGTFTTPLTVQRYLEPTAVTTESPLMDCAEPGVCEVSASTGPDDPEATAPITFARHSDDPTLVLDGATVAEGNGTASATFHVHLDRPATVPVTFWYASGLGGAPYDPNLTYAFGTEEIPAGQTELTVPFVVHGDRLDGPDREATFSVIGLTGAQLAGPPLIPITVRDDDPAPDVRVGSTTVREGNGPSFAFVPVTLNAVSGRDVRVDYVTHHDTARAGTDYVRTTGTLVIPAGQRSGRIPVVIVGDRVHERSERFHVAIDDAVHAHIADDDAFVTVHDDD